MSDHNQVCHRPPLHLNVCTDGVSRDTPIVAGSSVLVYLPLNHHATCIVATLRKLTPATVDHDGRAGALPGR